MYNSLVVAYGGQSSFGMISLYGGSLASVCLLIAVMVAVSLVTIGIRTVRLLCLTSCQMLWICVVFSLILFGICFLHGRRIANRLSGVILLWGNSISNSIGKIAIRSDLTHASIIIR